MADFDHVQTIAAGDSNDAPTVDAVFVSNVTAANFVVFMVSRDGGNTATVTKQAGTSTLGAFTKTVELNNGQHLEQWWAPVTGTGSLTVRVTFTGGNGNNTRFYGSEYAGPAGGITVVGTANNGPTPGATTSPSSGNISFTAAGLIVGALTPTTQAVTLAAGNLTAIRATSSNDGAGCGDRKITGSGSEAATFSTNVSEASNVTATGFQETGAGGGSTRGSPFGGGTAFNGGRALYGLLRRISPALTYLRKQIGNYNF